MTDDEDWIAKHLSRRPDEGERAFVERTTEITQILATLNTGGLELGAGEKLYRRLCELTGADPDARLSWWFKK